MDTRERQLRRLRNWLNRLEDSTVVKLAIECGFMVTDYGMDRSGIIEDLMKYAKEHDFNSHDFVVNFLAEDRPEETVFFDGEY